MASCRCADAALGATSHASVCARGLKRAIVSEDARDVVPIRCGVMGAGGKRLSGGADREQLGQSFVIPIRYTMVSRLLAKIAK